MLNLRLFLVTQAGPRLKTLLLNLLSPRNTDACLAFLKKLKLFSLLHLSKYIVFIGIVMAETEYKCLLDF